MGMGGFYEGERPHGFCSICHGSVTADKGKIMGTLELLESHPKI